MDGVGVYLTGVIGVIILYLVLRRPVKASTCIPGLAPSDPVKGNLGDIGAAGTLHTFQQKNHAKYGGIFSFWWGKKLVVSIADADYVRDITHLHMRPEAIFNFVKEWIGKDSIQYANGEEYQRRKRNYVDPAFGFRAVQKYENEILAIYTEDCFPTWRASVDHLHDLKQLSLSVAVKTITKIAFGADHSSPQLIEDFLSCYNVIWSHVYSTVKGEDSPIGEGEFKEKVKTMHGMCTQMAEARKAAGLSEPYRFIDLINKEENPALIASDMITFFVGGFHTTGYSIVWTLFYLAKHQKEQEKIRAEIEANIPKTQTVVTSSDLSSEKFSALYNFVEEVLRLGQPGPFAARYSDDTDVKLHDGKIIPKGTPIIQALAVMATTSGFWDNAMEFFPDRFKEQVDSCLYMPFGGLGKRACPGKTLLYAEMHLFLANLLRNFTVSFPDGFDSRVELVVGVITTMKNDPPLLLIPRT